MTLAQFTLARYSRQLRDKLQTEDLTEGEAEILIAIERDMIHWDKNGHDQVKQKQNSRRAGN